jgi:ABC-type Fe3+/spermidine/putrescine transport system ATPase subunit
LGDRIAVLNVGHLEQIGTPEEIYNHPATEHVATFLGAANVVPGVMRGERAEIGNCSLPLPAGSGPFKDGQAVNLIFRPEDVLLSRAEAVPMRHWRLANGIVDRINFVGAYERVSVRPDFSPAGGCADSESSFYLTTETPESQPAKLIVATRAKQEAASLRLKFGDRVVISLAAYTILPT